MTCVNKDDDGFYQQLLLEKALLELVVLHQIGGIFSISSSLN